MQANRLLIFRSATDDDQDFVYDLVKSSLPEVVGMPFPEWSRDDFRQSWERGTKSIITFDETWAGYMRWEHDPDALHLADLQIVPALRRQGLATHALTHFEHHAATEGFSKVSLVVHHANHAAALLYAKLGYRCETRDSSRSLLIKTLA